MLIYPGVTSSIKGGGISFKSATKNATGVFPSHSVGDLLVCIVGHNSAFGTIPGIPTNMTNVFTMQTGTNGNDYGIRVAARVATGTTFTASASNGEEYILAVIGGGATVANIEYQTNTSSLVPPVITPTRDGIVLASSWASNGVTSFCPEDHGVTSAVCSWSGDSGSSSYGLTLAWEEGVASTQSTTFTGPSSTAIRRGSLTLSCS